MRQSRTEEYYARVLRIRAQGLVARGVAQVAPAQAAERALEVIKRAWRSRMPRASVCAAGLDLSQSSAE